RDQIGRTIAFGARRINDEDEPKYLNSPETPLFDKSATLFGLDLAHRAIQRSGTAVIAEGYTDVIACHQAGITNVVATLGTALTPKHAVKLRQLCHTVILLFDGDEAGQRAADRAAEVFLALPIDVRIATLAGATNAKDPDELLKLEGGDTILRTVFDNAVDLLTFRDTRLRAELSGAGPAQIEARVRDEMRELGRLGLASADKVRWQFVIRQLNDLTGLDAPTIAALVREGAGRQRPAPADDQAAPTTPRSRTPIVEAVACLLADPSIFVGLDDTTKHTLLSAAADTDYNTIVQAIAAAAERSASPTLTAVLDVLSEQHIDTAPAIALERDIARRLSDDQELLRNTLTTCMQRMTANAEPKTTASPLDRIAELKSSRTGDRATDRTRLPRTRQ
ncbi:MAG: toprim domain-containing protein, partial [Planctomycetota bacterium]